MSARAFTHPNFGKEVRIEQYGREVHLIFVAGTQAQSDSMCDELLRQLKGGALTLTMMGPPTSIDVDECPVCGGTGVDDSQCACGDDTCCCLVPTQADCSWCGGAG
jgi:hypothetical protein